MEQIELEVAIEQLTKQIQPQMNMKTVSILKARNHHLASDIYASLNVPSFNRSAMDGYAVKASQTLGATKERPIKLKVMAEVFAGDYLSEQAPQNQAVRVMTGAYIPDGFDAVIRQEDTDFGELQVSLFAEVVPFQNYIKIGEDIKVGQLMIKKYTLLTPLHLGILASLGVAEVDVLEPLRVGIISSGSELVIPGQSLNEGQIFDSNRYVLEAKLREMNVDVIFSEKISDNDKELAEVIHNQINRVDLIVTTGGVSVGKKDMMHAAIERLGAIRLFWRIKMRPGTPVLASLYQDKLILSLSGNPFAALTTFELLFRPLIAIAMQDEGYTCKRQEALLMNDFSKKSKQRRFVRAYYVSGHVFLPTNEHASSVLSSMLDCNCFIDIKAGTEALDKGAKVEVVLLANQF